MVEFFSNDCAFSGSFIILNTKSEVSQINSETGECRFERVKLSKDNKMIITMNLTGDGQWLFAGGENCGFLQFHIGTQRVVREFSGLWNSATNLICVTPNARYIYVCDFSGDIFKFCTRSGKILLRFQQLSSVQWIKGLMAC
jgi:hypothetical protein